MVFILCLVLFGVFCVVALTNYIHLRFLDNYIMTYSEQIVGQAGMQVDNTLHRMEISENQILVSIAETAFYDVNASDKQRYASGSSLLDTIRIIKQNNDDIANIHIYVPSIDALYSAETNVGRPRIRKRLTDFLQSDSRRCYELRYDENSGAVDGIISFVPVYALYPRREKVAVFCIELKHDAAFGALDQINVKGELEVCLVDTNGEVFYRNADDDIGINVKEVIGELRNAPKRIRKNGRIIVSHPIVSSRWTLLGAFDYFSLFRELAKGSLLALALCSGSIILLITFGFLRESGEILGPINELVRHLEEYPEKAEFIQTIQPNNPDIATLVNSYNRMIERIDVLHQKSMEEERARIDAEYKALIAQINPHFLFNSLENLRGVAMFHNAPELSQTINALSLMLRYSLSGSGDAVLLSDEIDNVKQYMKVVHSRIEYDIQVRYDIDEEARNCHVIKFLLQPIVENAVLYGELDAVSPCGMIDITARKTSEILKISIRDNGAGMSPENLEALNKTVSFQEPGDEYAKGSGIGLLNIAKRLRFTFGTSAGMSVRNAEDAGLVVTIVIDYSTD